MPDGFAERFNVLHWALHDCKPRHDEIPSGALTFHGGPRLEKQQLTGYEQQEDAKCPPQRGIGEGAREFGSH